MSEVEQIQEQTPETEIKTQGFWGEEKRNACVTTTIASVLACVVMCLVWLLVGGDEGPKKSISTHHRPVVEFIPVKSRPEKLEAIRSASARFDTTKSYLDTIPTNHTLLEGIHNDASAPAEVRAASWAVFEDDETFMYDSFNVTRRFALAVLYFETEGENWFRSGNWLTSVSHCEWEGVVCALEALVSPAAFRSPKLEVVSLKMQRNNLAGQIPDSLVFFQGLGDLLWTENKLTGSLNEKVFRSLPLLQTLYLSYNRMTGEIPVLYNENKTLDYLLLHGNNFTGTIPQDYCDTTHGPYKEKAFTIDCDKVACTIPHCCDPFEVCS